MPVVPNASATEPPWFDLRTLTAAIMVFKVNVLPVPPLASIKRQSDAHASIASNTVSNS